MRLTPTVDMFLFLGLPYSGQVRLNTEKHVRIYRDFISFFVKLPHKKRYHPRRNHERKGKITSHIGHINILTFCSIYQSKARPDIIFSLYSSLRLACLCFLLIPPENDLSLFNKFKLVCRTVARFSVEFRCRIRHASSFIETSNCQCRLW